VTQSEREEIQKGGVPIPAAVKVDRWEERMKGTESEYFSLKRALVAPQRAVRGQSDMSERVGVGISIVGSMYALACDFRIVRGSQC
jgi:hypothetical protein